MEFNKNTLKKKFLFFILLLIVLLIGIGIWYTSSNTSDSKKFNNEILVEASKDSKLEDEYDSNASLNEDTSKPSSNESHTSSNTSGSSVNTSNPNTSENTSTTKPSTSGNTGGSTTKPSTGGNTGTAPTKPSTGGNTSTTPTKPSEPQKPAHIHSWEPVYKEVDNGYYEEVVVGYNTYERCEGCGADVTKNPGGHMMEHIATDGTHYNTRPVRVPITEKEWVPVIEKELVGYKCSGCGATK